MIKVKELRQKSKNEMEAMLRENREKLRHLRFELSSRKLKNVREIGQTKKLVAQILTVLKQS